MKTTHLLSASLMAIVMFGSCKKDKGDTENKENIEYRLSKVTVVGSIEEYTYYSTGKLHTASKQPESGQHVVETYNYLENGRLSYIDVSEGSSIFKHEVHYNTAGKIDTIFVYKGTSLQSKKIFEYSANTVTETHYSVPLSSESIRYITTLTADGKNVSKKEYYVLSSSATIPQTTTEYSDYYSGKKNYLINHPLFGVSLFHSETFGKELVTGNGGTLEYNYTYEYNDGNCVTKKVMNKGDQIYEYIKMPIDK